MSEYQLMTEAEFFHWLNPVFCLTVVLMFSSICLLMCPISLLAGLMRRHVGLFRDQHNKFQDQLQQDIRKISSSTKAAFIPADKTTNFYEVDKLTYDKLLMDNLTSTYKKANTNTIRSINNEAKNIATDLLIDDRVECMAERQAFITLKDHKDNFVNKPMNKTRTEHHNPN